MRGYFALIVLAIGQWVFPLKRKTSIKGDSEKGFVIGKVNDPKDWEETIIVINLKKDVWFFDDFLRILELTNP